MVLSPVKMPACSNAPTSSATCSGSSRATEKTNKTGGGVVVVLAGAGGTPPRSQSLTPPARFTPDRTQRSSRASRDVTTWDGTRVNRVWSQKGKRTLTITKPSGPQPRGVAHVSVVARVRSVVEVAAVVVSLSCWHVPAAPATRCRFMARVAGAWSCTPGKDNPTGVEEADVRGTDALGATGWLVMGLGTSHNPPSLLQSVTPAVAAAKQLLPPPSSTPRLTSAVPTGDTTGVARGEAWGLKSKEGGTQVYVVWRVAVDVAAAAVAAAAAGEVEAAVGPTGHSPRPCEVEVGMGAKAEEGREV